MRYNTVTVIVKTIGDFGKITTEQISFVEIFHPSSVAEAFLSTPWQTYLFWGELWGGPGVTSLEGLVLVNDQQGVLRSLPSKPITNINKVIVVDIMDLTGTFTVLTGASEMH